MQKSHRHPAGNKQVGLSFEDICVPDFQEQALANEEGCDHEII